MSSVFDQAFNLSQAISNSVVQNGILKMLPVSNPGIHQYDTDPLSLLHSFGINFPNKADLIIFDSPRASKRLPVNLYAADGSGGLHRKDISYGDPNYKFLHIANLLAYSRLIANALSEDGILIAITTPEVYLNVRGSIEHYLGSDKYIGELVYQSRSGGGADSTWLSTDHETMLIFSKNPQLISRFQLAKEEVELRKYNLEDGESRYYWDTYIRKNARNYYQIEAPDGEILEIDDAGNRISWLWRKQTFIEKYRAGDIKFEKLNNKWKLYYKDRLKDVKILRSLSLNSTLLKDIDETLPSELKGGDLLNSKGSEEIKSFVGAKPDYLKPSNYFKFIYSIFNKRGGVTLIPFAEYGSAAIGVSMLNNEKSSVLTNNPKEYHSLVDWRIDDLGLDPIVKVLNESFNLTSFFNSNGEISLNIITQLISLKYGTPEIWSDYIVDDVELVYNFFDGALFLLLRNINPNDIPSLGKHVAFLISKVDASEVVLFSEYSTDLISSNFNEQLKFDNIQLHKIPEFFTK